MKKYIYCLSFLFLLNCSPEKEERVWSGWYKLSGNIVIVNKTKVELSYELKTDSTSTRIVKSTMAKDGKFSFTGKINEPVYANLKIGTRNINFYIDATDQEIELNQTDIYKYQLRGGWTDKDARMATKIYDSVADSIQTVRTEIFKKETILRKNRNPFTILMTIQELILLKKTHKSMNVVMSRPAIYYANIEPNSFVMLLDMNKQQALKARKHYLQEIFDTYDRMDVSLKNTPTGIIVGQKIDSIMNLHNANLR